MDRLIPVRNRPGVFAVVSVSASERLADGMMKLYQDTNGIVWVETITRARFALTKMDAFHRKVFIAVGENGQLITESDEIP